MAAKGKSVGTSDAVEILRRRFVDGRPDMERLIDAERSNARIARDLFDLRTRAGLTQKELAHRAGTTPSVISRLESADYEGHSLSMLRKIGSALGLAVEVTFTPMSPVVSTSRSSDR